MGREFIDLFDEWANHYDTTVEGYDEEYKDVFLHYENILQEVVNQSGDVVLEFGCGTGNLTQKLIQAHKKVYSIEPSEMMRKKAKDKLANNATIEDGDFLTFPIPNQQVDTIVSTYAFHHLTDEEKEKAIGIYGSLLQNGGKIVFADTAFIDQQAKEDMIHEAKQKGYMRLAEDLQTEYYTTHKVLQTIFRKHGFTITFTQMNAFVWLIQAVKQ
ncbi:class I SAM-dependent methyltransferase [Bacillus sp. FJAT-47783]|uniref:class I SAM-dependent methyltransferase n=1 Tax=Bacillus sp. FJAT-47783 TaxID=2922712 RepID=UPI001FAE0E1D